VGDRDDLAYFAFRACPTRQQAAVRSTAADSAVSPFADEKQICGIATMPLVMLAPW